jgi:hypothetical protein
MNRRDRIIAEVNASMSFEGLPLSKSNIACLKKCYGKPQAHYQELRKKLVQQYTSSDDMDETPKKL